MKVLVTGAAGFIGSFLIKALAIRGHSVLGIDNINDYYDIELKYDRLRFCGIDQIADTEYGEIHQSYIYPTLRFVKADICDSDYIDQIIASEQPDCICNLAAQAGVRYSIKNPRSYIDTNLTGFFNVMDACRKASVSHFIYASSSSVYGRNSKIPFSESDMTDSPVSLYAATKKAGELMAHAYSSIHNMHCTGLRFFTVYGPYGRPDMAPFLFADAMLSGNPIKIFNNGHMRRDFTYIDDIVHAIVLIVESNVYYASSKARIFNVGNSSPVDLMDFVTTMEQCLGIKAHKEYLDMQLGDVPDTYSDSSALQSEFHYCPNTSITEGLSRFCEWMRNYRAGEKK